MDKGVLSVRWNPESVKDHFGDNLICDTASNTSDFRSMGFGEQKHNLILF
jgi:hypothetical protein